MFDFTDLQITMNLKVDPCEDFHEFVCGNFENHPTGRTFANKSFASLKTELLYEDLIAKLRKVASEPIKEEQFSYAKKAKIVYQTCEANSKNEQYHKEIIYSFRMF